MSTTQTFERAYRVRLRLKPEQERMLRRLLGAKRFVWNWALGRQTDARAAGEKRPGMTALSREFTALRQAPGTEWLGTLPREPFNQVLRDLDRAWTNFFAGRARRPRRRRFGTVMSARFTLDQRRQQVDRDRGVVQLDGIGKVRFRVTQPLDGRLRSATVSLDSAGRWHAAFTADQVEVPEEHRPGLAAVGIDFGLKSTAALSTGETLRAPKHLAGKLARLRRYQRSYVRQRDAAARRMGLDPGRPFPKSTRIEVSNRMRRRRRQIGRLHAQVADQRRDHQHQLTARVVAGAQVICIEDLNVRAMHRGMGRRAFRRSVGDAALGEIRRQLTYKAAWRGRQVSVVDRFYPSSKTCSGCGHVHAGLKLKDRRWTCPACGADHDRDINAAINIEREGLRLLASTGPAGRTPRSGGSDARGEAACAVTRTSVAGQPTSENRELAYRAAQPPTTGPPGNRTGPRVEG